MSLVEVRVPDLGDAKGVNVVDILVKKGDEIRIEDPLITLETEKASMDVPLIAIKISPGAKVPSAPEPGCTSSTTNMPVNFGYRLRIRASVSALSPSRRSSS